VIRFRTSRPGDIRDLIGFYRNIYKEKYSFNQEFEEEGISELQGFLEHFSYKMDAICIAEEHGFIVGSIIVSHEGRDKGIISWLHVKPEYRDSNAKANLLKKATEFCTEKEYDTISLKVVSPVEKDIQLYIEEGFKLYSQRKVAKYGLDLTEEIYEKKLPETKKKD
jgi:ribosomal protein S18 acetylase RimI-like enzyme